MGHEWTDAGNTYNISTETPYRLDFDTGVRRYYVLPGIIGAEILRLAERVRELEGQSVDLVNERLEALNRAAALEEENQRLREELEQYRYEAGK